MDPRQMEAMPRPTINQVVNDFKSHLISETLQRVYHVFAQTLVESVRHGVVQQTKCEPVRFNTMFQIVIEDFHLHFFASLATLSSAKRFQFSILHFVFEIPSSCSDIRGLMNEEI